MHTAELNPPSTLRSETNYEAVAQSGKKIEADILLSILKKCLSGQI